IEKQQLSQGSTNGANGATEARPTNGVAATEENEPTKPPAPPAHKEVSRKFSDESGNQAANSVPGSIGKLRISTEMRAKLEQLTIDQSVRSSRKEPKAGV